MKLWLDELEEWAGHQDARKGDRPKLKQNFRPDSIQTVYTNGIGLF